MKEMARRAMVAVSGLEPSEGQLEDLVRTDLAAFVGNEKADAGDLSLLPTRQVDDAEAAVALAERHGLKSPIEALVWNGSQPAPHASVAECVEAYLAARAASGCAASTMACYRRCLNQFLKEFGTHTLAAVTPAEMATYLVKWERENTRRSHWSTLHAFFRWLTNIGFMRVNPVRAAMRAPKSEASAGIIYTPYEVMRVLHAVMFTDQIGFWVLSLYAGMRIKEIERLQKQPNPWKFIDLRRKEIRLSREITGTIARVILISPVLAEWLCWVRRRNAPFFPHNHWKKYPVMQSFALGKRLLSRIPRKRNAAPARLRAVSVSRRTYIAYRMAISGADLALTSDEVDHPEKYMRATYALKVSLREAKEFFSLTPDYVRREAVAAHVEPFQIHLKFKKGRSSTRVMAASTTNRATSDLGTQWVIPMGRPKAIILFEEEMVGLFIDAADLLGLPRSVAAVYGLLFASPQPLSFSEIAARLSFSNGSVSTGLKTLRGMGAVRLAEAASGQGGEGEEPTRRRDRYEPDTEMRRLLQRFIEQRLETQLSRGNARLTNLNGAASAFAAADRKVMEQRLYKLRRWHDRTRAMMPVIRTFLKLAKG